MIVCVCVSEYTQGEFDRTTITTRVYDVCTTGLCYSCTGATEITDFGSTIHPCINTYIYNIYYTIYIYMITIIIASSLPCCSSVPINAAEVLDSFNGYMYFFFFFVFIYTHPRDNTTSSVSLILLLRKVVVKHYCSPHEKSSSVSLRAHRASVVCTRVPVRRTLDVEPIRRTPVARMRTCNPTLTRFEPRDCSGGEQGAERNPP